MSSATIVDGMIDAVVDRINANTATLGGITSVIVRDMDPAYIAEHCDMPAAAVLPFKGGEAELSWRAADEIEMHFPITIVGLYNTENVSPTNMDIIGYGFNALDLFKGSGALIGAGVIGGDGSLKFGEQLNVDQIMQYWVLSMSATVIL